MTTRPLDGLRVVVTRAVHQADELVTAFEAAGAVVERIPLVEIVAPLDAVPLARAAAEVDRYAWVAFTSTNAVAAFLRRRARPWPGGTRVAAVGPATAEALRAAGLEPDLVAADPRGEGLATELGTHLAAGTRVLLPQAEDGRPETAAGLRAAGAEVDAVVAYRKRRCAASAARLRAAAGEPGTWITLTSPGLAREVAEICGESWPRVRAAARFLALGATTAVELRRLGVEPSVASEPTPKAMVETVVASLLPTPP